MQKLATSILLVFSLLSIFCNAAIGNIAKEHNDVREVLKRSRELSGAIGSGNADVVWELSSSWHKKDNEPKERSVALFLDLLNEVKISNKSTYLVKIESGYAITEATYIIQSLSGNQKKVSCFRTLWLKFPDNWYWHLNGLSCSYAPSEDELEYLLGRLNSPKKGLK